MTYFARWTGAAVKRLGGAGTTALLWQAGRWRFAVFCVLAVLQGLTPATAIAASGVLISGLPTDPARATLGLALFGASLLTGTVLAAILDHQAAVLDGRVARTIHDTVAHATLRTDVELLVDPRTTGELGALAEFERVDGFVGTVTALRELLRQRATGVGAAVVLATFAWWAPLVMFLGWRGLSFGVRRWLDHGMNLGARQGEQALRRARYLRGLAVDSPAAKEVRVFGLAGWLVPLYRDSYLAALEVLWEGRRLGMRTVLAATGGVVLAHLIVLTAIAQTTTTPAEIVVYAQAVLSTSALGYVFGAEVPLARARKVAKLARALADRLATSPPPAKKTANAIELKNVHFTYPGRDDEVLAGVNLTVPKGQSLAIVGENGAGKSTLVHLLCGTYRPQRGEIAMPGEVSAIVQRFTRFELSLRDNIGFGAGDETVHRALERAGGLSLLDDLPHGWDTVLSSSHPDGRDLSGGQWQKVALARALLAVETGAEVLIMDEPSANLDVLAEEELFARFSELAGEITTILVSHRLASVRHADRIVVIADGRIAEDGTHAELMAANGRYAAMYSLQAERFAEKEWSHA
ncbi:ABC transporter ATP-binding protein [Lentzea flava]|uniref:Multidrug ABC transporter permease n=1 Tax=Lentzea flava TaxID=103732 RepID=A0ABQ2UAS0_9PSEU|nr:ABC transporter ATP-binding protein [Lentzea flava]MCP2197130.1 ATP-binding cassette, subfamily B [Lentzea flava]GGU13142.1 multidrug ABC transporter permease [Lentzea flava]